MHESTFRRMVWKSFFGETCWGEHDAFPFDSLRHIYGQTQHVGRLVQGGISHGLDTALGWPQQ
jgi:hypothetical protein